MPHRQSPPDYAIKKASCFLELRDGIDKRPIVAINPRELPDAPKAHHARSV